MPFPPGGPTDVLGRVVGEGTQRGVAASRWWSRTRSGAAGNIGVDLVAKAAPDGYTFGVVPAGNIAVNPRCSRTCRTRQSDLAPVTMLATVENVLVVNAARCRRSTLKELLALAAQKPGALSYASPGAGSQAHLAGELLELSAGVDLLHVPYRGIAPAVNDLVGGQVTMMFAPLPVGAAAHQERQAARASASPARSARRCCPSCRRSPSRASPSSKPCPGTR